jgi:putative polyketide hydroxylase
MNETSTQMTADLEPPVLVVGGGVVGLSAALFLAAQDIPVVLVERHPTTSIHPRAWGWYPRTLELLRSVGAEPRVLEAAAGFADHRINGRVESLTGAELSRTILPDAEDLSDITPCRQVSLGQDRMEPLIRAAAQERGAQLLFGTRLLDLQHDDDGVTARIADRDSGVERTIRARYVIAADGARSPIRTTLGVPAHGRSTFRHQVSILFRADLSGPLNGRRFSICQIENPTVTGVLGHDDTLQEATLILTYQPDAGEAVSDFTEQRCVELVRAAIGDDDIPVAIRDVLPWEMAALVAERFRVGRVFFAGDSAHIIPPIGGYGANTGVQDAHNLAWKLAAVLRGQAGPELLDTYEQERLPVARNTVEQASMRLAVRAGFATPQQREQLLDALAVSMGYRYPGTDGPIFAHPAQRAGEVGTRAPHLWLDADSSVLDLFGDGFVLLAGPDGAAWANAAKSVADELDVPIRAHVLPGEVAELWERRYGATRDGAVLVRPDGFVAARWPAADDEAALGVHLAAATRAALHRS